MRGKLNDSLTHADDGAALVTFLLALFGLALQMAGIGSGEVKRKREEEAEEGE